MHRAGIAGVFCLALIALAGPAGPARAAPSPSDSMQAQHAQAAAGCTTAMLSVIPMGGAVAMGNVGMELRFQNRSSRACTLYGYPGAQLLNAKRQPISTHLTWSPAAYLFQTKGKQLVTLAPGRAGYFILEWTDVPSGVGPCPAAPYIKVTPPNTRTSIVLSPGKGGIGACGGKLTASPVVARPFPGFGAGGRIDYGTWLV